MYLSQGQGISVIAVCFIFFLFRVALPQKQFGLPFRVLLPKSIHIKNYKSKSPPKSELIVFLVEEKSHRQVLGKTKTSVSFNVDCLLEENLADVCKFSTLLKCSSIKFCSK